MYLSNKVRKKRATAWPNYLNYEWIKWANALSGGKKASCCAQFATFSNTISIRAWQHKAEIPIEWRCRPQAVKIPYEKLMDLLPGAGFLQKPSCHAIVCATGKFKISANLACSVMVQAPWIPLQATAPLLVRRRKSNLGITLLAVHTAWWSGITQWSGKQNCHQSCWYCNGKLNCHSPIIMPRRNSRGSICLKPQHQPFVRATSSQMMPMEQQGPMMGVRRDRCRPHER